MDARTILVDRDKCDICGTCVAVCGSSALRITHDLEVDTRRCTRCKRCIRICPVGALTLGDTLAERPERGKQ